MTSDDGIVVRDLSVELADCFVQPSDHVYLNAAAESLFLRSNRDALRRYADQKSAGSDGRPSFTSTERHCRELVARAIACQPEDVAFVASTSRGLDIAIKSIAWHNGDNIVLSPGEFPTALIATDQLSQRGIATRQVLPGADPMEGFREQIDERTRLVIASAVSFKDGTKTDLGQLAQLAHRHGGLLFVDAIQAVGAVPMVVGSADFVCAGTYKWLLGAHGLAFLYLNPQLDGRLAQPYAAYRGVVDLFPEVRPKGYRLHRDARRLEEGMPNFPSMYVLENSLGFLLKIGIEDVAAYNATLIERLAAGLAARGIPMLTPATPSRRGSIVSFESPEPDRIAHLLDRSGIRIWARDGRVRVSPNFYNSAEHIDRFLVALDEIALPTQ